MAVTPGSLMQEIADYSLQFPIIALRYYDFTGDREGLVRADFGLRQNTDQLRKVSA